MKSMLSVNLIRVKYSLLSKSCPRALTSNMSRFQIIKNIDIQGEERV